MVGITKGPSKLAWGATESEQSNIHGEQPAAMHQSNENVGNVPNRSQESPLHYGAQFEDIMRLLSLSLVQQQEMLLNYEKTIKELRSDKKEMQQEYEKTIKELRSDKKEMQQEYEKTIRELLSEKKEMQQKYEKAAEKRDEMMTKEREEYLKKIQKLEGKLAYNEDYTQRLKNRGFFRRLFNLEPE